MTSSRNFKVPTTRELFKCLINRKEWRSKSPLRKWSYLYGIGKSLCNVIKMPPYREDQTLCWFSYFPVFYVSTHLILVVYTTVHYILLGEFNKFLPCTCLFFGPIAGVCNHFIIHMNQVFNECKINEQINSVLRLRPFCISY